MPLMTTLVALYCLAKGEYQAPGGDNRVWMAMVYKIVTLGGHCINGPYVRQYTTLLNYS